MAKKAVGKLPEPQPGKRKGFESPATLNLRAEALRNLMEKTKAISASADKLAMESIEVDGALKFDRGITLLESFLEGCHAAVSKEKFRRGMT